MLNQLFRKKNIFMLLSFFSLISLCYLTSCIPNTYWFFKSRICLMVFIQSSVLAATFSSNQKMQKLSYSTSLNSSMCTSFNSSMYLAWYSTYQAKDPMLLIQQTRKSGRCYVHVEKVWIWHFRKMDFYSGESNYTPSTFVFIPTWDEELKIMIICC